MSQRDKTFFREIAYKNILIKWFMVDKISNVKEEEITHIAIAINGAQEEWMSMYHHLYSSVFNCIERKK